MYVCMYVCIHIYIHIIHTHTHTHIYIYIYIYILRSPLTMTRDPGMPEYQGEPDPKQETYNK